MAKKETALSTQLSKEQMAILDSSYPIEESQFTRVLLPRLGMVSQDVMEGKGKLKKVTTEAGTFFTEHQTDEEDENGKKIWKREEIGTEIEAIILYERKQLSYYDKANEVYTSSPIFDSKDQELPLFKDKVEIDRGTPAELKSRKEYQGVTAAGKPKSNLEDIKILYVLYKDEVYQMNIRGTSMYAFIGYKKTVQPNKVVTRMNSEAKENGAIEWNQMTFENARSITSKEAEVVIKHVQEIQTAIEAEKAFYASQKPLTKQDLAEAKRRRDADEDF